MKVKFLIVFLLFSQFIYGGDNPFAKGSIIGKANVSMSIHNGGIYSTNGGAIALDINPSINYFLLSDVSIGVNVQLSKITGGKKDDILYNTVWGFGTTMNYYFSESSFLKENSPYLLLSYIHSLSSSEFEKSDNIGVGTGLLGFVNNSIGINFELAYYFINPFSSFDNGKISVAIGINLF